MSKLRFDPKKIAFPTDSITMGRMRLEQPYFPSTAARLGRTRACDLDVVQAYQLELRLAERSFDAALGRLDREWGSVQRNDAMHVLNGIYTNYGISTGMHKTNLILERLERSAAKQAEVAYSANRECNVR